MHLQIEREFRFSDMGSQPRLAVETYKSAVGQITVEHDRATIVPRVLSFTNNDAQTVSVGAEWAGITTEESAVVRTAEQEAQRQAFGRVLAGEKATA